jgi:polyhydroxybutyrate depolymerase
VHPSGGRGRSATRVVAFVLAVGMLLVACGSGGATIAGTTGPGGDCVPTRPARHGTDVVRTNIGGVERDYELAIPRRYDGTTRAPLLLSLHGFTSSIADVDAVSRYPRQAGRRGYVVVTPQAPRVVLPVTTGLVDVPLWNIAPVFQPRPGTFSQASDGDDLGYLERLLDHLESTLCIDTGREYVSGISLGAGMTMALVCAPGRRFAAAAPVAGVNLATRCPDPHATPLIAFHGDADPFVRFQGRDFFGLDVGLPAVPARMARFAELSGCDPDPTTSRPRPGVRLLAWRCPTGMAAELYQVVDGGHSWPGAPREEADAAGVSGGLGASVRGRAAPGVDATSLILDFFDRHRRTP